MPEFRERGWRGDGSGRNNPDDFVADRPCSATATAPRAQPRPHRWRTFSSEASSDVMTVPDLRAGLHDQPNDGRGPFMAPEGLAILREPAFDGGAVKCHPEWLSGRSPVLLHVVARVADQRRQRRILIGRAPPGDSYQHDLHRRLRRSPSGPYRNARGRDRRLIELGAGQRTACIGQAQAATPKHKNYSKTQISSANVAVVLCHGVIT